MESRDRKCRGRCGEEFEGKKQTRHWRENPEITPGWVGEQALESNIQDNPKVIWGMEISTTVHSYREHKRKVVFGGRDFANLV